MTGIPRPAVGNPPPEFTVRLTGARMLPAGTNEATRLPRRLAATVSHCAVPSVTWQVGVDPGAGTLSATMTGAASTVGELGALLADTHTYSAPATADPDGAAYWWALAPTSKRVGFFNGSDAPAEHRWAAPHQDPTMETMHELYALLSRNPGLIYRVHLTGDQALPTGGTPVLHARIHIGHPGPELPARIVAVLAELLPGLHLVDDHDRSWTVGMAALPHLWRLPLAGGGRPVPGFPVAEPAPLPIAPLPGTRTVDTEGAITIGVAFTSSGREQPWWITGRERARHLHITGHTGAGKSTALKAVMHELAARGEGFAFLDFHGDTAEAVAAELPDHTLDRVWYLDAADPATAAPMNPLAILDPNIRDIVIQDITDVFYALFDPRATGIVGPRYEVMLRMALRGLANLHGPRASLLDVPRVYSDATLLAEIEGAAVTIEERNHWRVESASRRSNEYGDRVSWFTSKFDRFTGTAALRAILGTGNDAFDPGQAMDDNKIILIDLSKGQLGEVAARLLGFLHVTRFWTAALRRRRRNPFTLIVDEAHTLTAGSLINILSEGRKFGLSAVIAHQYLGQLDQPLREAIAGNTATTIAFRAGPADAASHAARYGSTITAEHLTGLPDLTAICQRTAGPVGPSPHTVRIDHYQHVHERAGQQRTDWLRLLKQRTTEQLITPHLPAAPAELPPPPTAPPTRHDRVPGLIAAGATTHQSRQM